MTTLCLSDAFGFDELPPDAVLGRPKPEPNAREDEPEQAWLRRLVRDDARSG
jgi:hypothetical protein